MVVRAGSYFVCPPTTLSLRTNETTPVYLPLTLVRCVQTISANSTLSNLTALTPAGYGQGLQLVLTMGSQTSVLSLTSFGYGTATFGYISPSISGLGGSLLLPTLGVYPNGSVANVTIYGSNFGSLSSPLVVSFKSPLDNITRTASVCSRDPVGHAWITCNAVAGVGKLHSWTVSVGGQTSAASVATTSYNAPTLASISGPGSSNANTDGGQLVYVNGYDFGPLSSSVGGVNDRLISVMYGPSSNTTAYWATGCTVTAAVYSGSSVLTCFTSAGIGSGLIWSLVIGTQNSTGSAPTTSYGRPIVSTLTGAGSSGAVTSGNQTVVVTGFNFGPIGTPVLATYSTHLSVSSIVNASSAIVSSYGSTNNSFAYGANGAEALFPAVNCIVVVAHNVINCSTSAGAGFNIGWTLSIGNQTSQSPVTAYSTPTITDVRMVSMLVNGTTYNATDPIGNLTALSTEGGDVIQISGTNFGPAYPRSYISGVWYSGSGVEYDLSNCTFVTAHQVFTCVTVPGVGTGYSVQMTVLGQSSPASSQIVSYHAPVIMSASPSTVSTSGGTIVLSGLNFGNDISKVSVSVDGMTLSSVGFVTAHRSLTVSIGDAMGVASRVVQVTVGGQSSNTVTVSVLAPAVTSVGVYDASGGSVRRRGRGSGDARRAAAVGVTLICFALIRLRSEDPLIVILCVCCAICVCCCGGRTRGMSRAGLVQRVVVTECDRA